ncbi:hypothetical protein CPB83DRAFT_864541 [Crepidotus variabilis]|uniref:RBR-type E3 ubiquitin transferase n=1 Tax=Crepidotus variabilis TaxID=179855 RepID=A0A9P6E4E7_9AGAR|nr:hypothetical protein CPB83DRAFT_864541 [Crepidotus variabilis]
MDKNLVTFGAGLEVRTVTPSFEVNKISVKGLSLDSTPEAVASLFIDRGIAPNDVFVPFRTRPDKNGVGEALVYVNTAKNPEIIDDLQGVTLSDQVLDIRDVERANGGAPHQTAGAGDESPFLEISWKSPTETVFAHYTSRDKAAQQAEALNGKMWEGRRLNASVEKERVANVGGLFGRLGGRPITHTPARIKISNCPLNSSDNTRFSEFIHSSKVTHHDVSPCSSTKTVRQRLSRQDGVVMSTYKIIADENTPFAKIKVDFRDWSDVTRAHTALNDHKLATIDGETPLLRASFPARYRYQVTIPMRQYRAQTKQWNSLLGWSTASSASKKTMEDAYIQTDTVNGERGSIMAIKIVGDNDKATGALKVRVEGLVAGECLDAAHWHPTFGFNEDTRSMCNRIWETTNVYTKVDIKARALRVFGEPSMVEKAKIMVQEEVERLGGFETVRVIDWRGGISFFVQGGLAKLKEIVGEDRVRLDLTCKPPKITIQGTEEARYDLDRIIEEGKQSASADRVQKLGDGGATCPICTEDVVNGEQLGCGHTYCTSCLKHLLSSIVDTKAFPIVCWGDNSKCKSPITLPFLRRFIRHQVLSKLAEAAFVGYLETHPHELKYCPTPDCRQIYRHNATARRVQCPSCLFEICVACDREAHGGISCEAAKQAEQGDEQLEKAGCKKCPGCPAWILKSEGCNHMHCKYCNTHFCWVCGKAFGKSQGAVYDHMNSEHGGIYC